MMRQLAALLSGIIFGIGLALSQMINPEKVLGFLDIAAAAPGIEGGWDPTLAFVMAGALAVTFLGYRLVLRRPGPIFEPGGFRLPTRTELDPRLIGGAAVFGVGWGLVGFCPGPALSSLAFGLTGSFVFVIAMLAGAALYHLADRRGLLVGSSS